MNPSPFVHNPPSLGMRSSDLPKTVGPVSVDVEPSAGTVVKLGKLEERRVGTAPAELIYC